MRILSSKASTKAATHSRNHDITLHDLLNGIVIALEPSVPDCMVQAGVTTVPGGWPQTKVFEERSIAERGCLQIR
jgi:hypothetical protein